MTWTLAKLPVPAEELPLPLLFACRDKLYVLVGWKGYLGASLVVGPFSEMPSQEHRPQHAVSFQVLRPKSDLTAPVAFALASGEWLAGEFVLPDSRVSYFVEPSSRVASDEGVDLTGLKAAILGMRLRPQQQLFTHPQLHSTLTAEMFLQPRTPFVFEVVTTTTTTTTSSTTPTMTTTVTMQDVLTPPMRIALTSSVASLRELPQSARDTDEWCMNAHLRTIGAQCNNHKDSSAMPQDVEVLRYMRFGEEQELIQMSCTINGMQYTCWVHLNLLRDAFESIGCSDHDTLKAIDEVIYGTTTPQQEQA